jgi:hypothetical protein
MGGREVCAKCGLPSTRGRASPTKISWPFRKAKARTLKTSDTGRYFFSKPVGAAIVVTTVVVSTLVPNLPVLDRKSFVAIANSKLPNGYPLGKFGELVREPVFQSVIQNGGQIIISSKLDDTKSRLGDAGLGQIAGNWDPNTGTMKLRTGNFTYEQYLLTLNHEAIHMAQSCRANSIKGNPLPIGLAITAEGLSKLEPYRSTNPSYYHSQVEREAYSNDRLNPNTIAKIIKDQCGVKPWIPFFGNLRSIIQAAFLGTPPDKPT